MAGSCAACAVAAEETFFGQRSTITYTIKDLRGAAVQSEVDKGVLTRNFGEQGAIGEGALRALVGGHKRRAVWPIVCSIFKRLVRFRLKGVLDLPAELSMAKITSTLRTGWIRG